MSGTGARPADGPGLTPKEIEALALAFSDLNEAKRIVHEVLGARTPWTASSAYAFWHEVAEQLANGRAVDGRERLLAAAATEFPGNPSFVPSAWQDAPTAPPGTSDPDSAPATAPRRTPSGPAAAGRATRVGGWLRSRWWFVGGGSIAAAAIATSVLLAAAVTGDGNHTPQPSPASPARHSLSAADRSLETAHGSKAVRSLAFSPGDGSVLASAGYDKTLQRWDVTDLSNPTPLGEPLGSFEGPVYSVAFAPGNATILATGSENQSAQLWNVTDPRRPSLLGRLPVPDRLLYSVAFDPNDATLLATAGSDGDARLWNVADLENPDYVSGPLTGHTDAVRSIAFSPDGNVLATASFDGTVRLWDTTNRSQPTQLDHLTEHTGEMTSVAFSPDSPILATAGLDNAVRLWDVTDPSDAKLLTKLDHTGEVWAVAFTPDGQTLASGDGSAVALWDVSDPATAQRVGVPLTGHTEEVRSVAFAPGGRVLASGDNGGAVRLWTIDP